MRPLSGFQITGARVPGRRVRGAGHAKNEHRVLRVFRVQKTLQCFFPPQKPIHRPSSGLFSRLSRQGRPLPQTTRVIIDQQSPYRLQSHLIISFPVFVASHRRPIHPSLLITGPKPRRSFRSRPYRSILTPSLVWTKPLHDVTRLLYSMICRLLSNCYKDKITVSLKAYKYRSTYICILFTYNL